MTRGNDLSRLYCSAVATLNFFYGENWGIGRTDFEKDGMHLLCCYLHLLLAQWINHASSTFYTKHKSSAVLFLHLIETWLFQSA